MSSLPPAAPPLPPELDPRGRRPHRRRPSRSPLARAGWTLTVVLSALVLLVSVGGYALYAYYQGQLGRVDISLPGLAQPAATAAQNFLLVGSDTRNFAGGSAFQGSGASYVTGQRSDTIMLLHIPAGDGRVTLVSFPRDSWVQIPSYTDSHGVHHAAQMDKINAAFDLGGAPLLIRMIEKLSGLRIDHYVQVDFAGFENMVNALGGVTLCVGTTRHDHDSGDYLTAGVHQVNGAQALAFVRDRKGLPLGDIDRIKDQQYFLAQMLKKVLSAGTLANPLKLNAFLHAVTASVTVDNGFGLAQMETLATRMRHLDPAHVAMVTLPYTTADGMVDGQSVVLLNKPADEALFASLRSDRANHPATGSGSAATVPASRVHVQVLNGTGRTGLAQDTANGLAARGFHVDSVGNAPAPAGSTVVAYGPGQQAAARTVAAATGGTLRADSALGSVVSVTLGADFSGLASASGVSGATTPATGATGATTPATAPAAAPRTAPPPDCAP